MSVAGGTGEQVAGYRARRLKYALEYAALRIIVGTMHLLPLDFASWMMGSLWRLIAPHLRRHERAVGHLKAAYPEKSDAEIERIATSMWMQLGRTFAESLMLERIIRAGRIDDRSSPVLDPLKESAKGVVFVSLHTGNWELIVTPATAKGFKILGVYQRMKNPKVDDYVALARRDRYPRGLLAKGADIGRKIMRVVREGGAVALLADLRDRRGVMVPFFGRPAPSTTFPALLTRTSDAVMVAARCVRTGGVHFRIDAEVIEVPETADREQDIEEGTRRIHVCFEKWIREHPEQWMWAHRRWG